MQKYPIELLNSYPSLAELCLAVHIWYVLEGTSWQMVSDFGGEEVQSG